MKIKRILICDGTVDGIFTAIYQAYDMRYGHDNIKIVERVSENEGMNYELFSEMIDVETDFELAQKVGRSLAQKVSWQVYEYAVRVALSDVSGRSDLIYRFVILAFHYGENIVNHLTNDIVHQILSIDRYVGYEQHRMLEFVRFQEVEGDILLSIIKPKNNVVALIAPHFADRLNNENFLIYDEGRQIAAIHAKNSEIVMMDIEDEEIRTLKGGAADQKQYEELWRTFFHSIAIKERENLKLQGNMLPLRFRSNMTEFMKEDTSN